MYWKQWKEQRETKLKKLKDRANGFAELKPRHIKRVTEIYKDQFISSIDKQGSLNVLFELEYGEFVAEALHGPSPLLNLMKHKYEFEGKCLTIPINLSMEKTN